MRKNRNGRGSSSGTAAQNSSDMRVSSRSRTALHLQACPGCPPAIGTIAMNAPPIRAPDLTTKAACAHTPTAYQTLPPQPYAHPAEGIQCHTAPPHTPHTRTALLHITLVRQLSYTAQKRGAMESRGVLYWKRELSLLACRRTTRIAGAKNCRCLAYAQADNQNCRCSERCRVRCSPRGIMLRTHIRTPKHQLY